MRWRFSEVILWLICGVVLWHCAHSITLILPLPGPWLPTETAWVTGIIMGCLGSILWNEHLRRAPWLSQGLFWILGAVSGFYLGWVSARGALTLQEEFLPASTMDQITSGVVCGSLGLAANRGMSWLMEWAGDRPLRVLSFLLCLLLLLFAAVSFLVISHRSLP